ncbi:DNA topoisomerase IB, partial [Streptomyces sp. NPDC058650]
MHSTGGSASRAERARITDLAIPPAWQDVWISDAANAHILAVGVDAAGRRQYLYHP